MQGIISNILQRMKSASRSTISAPVYQGIITISQLDMGISWRCDIYHLVVGVSTTRPQPSRHGCVNEKVASHRYFLSHSNITSGKHSSILSFPARRPYIIKLHTYLDRATQMYATGAWLTFPSSAWDAHPLASPLEIGAMHLTSWDAGKTSVSALCLPI